MEVFTEEVIKIIKEIPEGFVMTYAQVAQIAGNKRPGRQVDWILSSMRQKDKLPWQRVINAKRESSDSGCEAREVLELEGVQFGSQDKGELSRYQYVPTVKHHHIPVK